MVHFVILGVFSQICQNYGIFILTGIIMAKNKMITNSVFFQEYYEFKFQLQVPLFHIIDLLYTYNLNNVIFQCTYVTDAFYHISPRSSNVLLYL